MDEHPPARPSLSLSWSLLTAARCDLTLVRTLLLASGARAATYLQLQHVRRAEHGRAQRWMCSWLYKLRACDDAERAQKGQPVPPGHGRCRRIEPPDHAAVGLGWRGHKVNALLDLAPLLFQFRCW